MHLPPEWWPQSAIMLTWPHAAGDWGSSLPKVEANFTEIAFHIAAHQDLLISAHDADAAQSIRRQLATAGVDMSKVHIALAASNDIWVRDHGPITVLDAQEPLLLNFSFNGWGAKYPAGLDNALTAKLHLQGCFGNTAIQSLDYVVEGGAIEVNGAGSLLTTANCLSLDTRNPDWSEDQLGEQLCALFGCSQVHWLRHGQLIGDDTDGHVDTLARFCDARTIVYQSCDSPQDEQYQELQAMAAELSALKDTQGQAYELHALPMPAAIYNAQGERLPASYANFLIINDAVLMPGYADPMDAIAAAVLADCFPDREIVVIDCRPLVEQFGSLHCATMQLPQAVSVQAPS